MLVVFDEEFNRGARGMVLKGFLARMEMAAIKATCRMRGSRSLLFLYEGPVTCEQGCKQGIRNLHQEDPYIEKFV
jgi:hypothetical protein